MKKITYFSLIYHVIAKFITVIGSFVSFNVIANFLGTAQYGYWAQISSSSNLLIPIVLVQLPIAYLRFYQSSKYPSEKSMGPFLIVNWVIFGLIALLFYIFDEAFADLIFGDRSLVRLLTLLLLYVFFKCNLQMLMAYFRASGQTNLYSNILIAESAIQILLLLLLVVGVHMEIEGVVYSFVIIDAVIVFILIIWMTLIKRSAGWRNITKMKAVMQFIHYSLPLVPHMFLFWVLNLSDRFFLVHYRNIETAGIYNAAYLFGNMLIVFQVALNFVVLPEAIRLWEANQKYAAFHFLRLLQNLYLITGIFIVGLFTVAGGALIEFVGTTEFAVSRTAVFLITSGCLLVGTDQFLRNIFHLYRKTRILPMLFSLSALTNVVINFLLIPKFGIEGAALSTFITFTVQYLIFSFFAYRMALFQPDLTAIIKTVLLVAAISFALLQLDEKYIAMATIVSFAIAYFIVVLRFKWIDLGAIKAALADRLPGNEK